jgi:hypothetical protein
MSTAKMMTLKHWPFNPGVLLVFLLVSAIRTWAQSDTQNPVPPDGALLAAAPSFSQWRVTFTYPEELAKKDDGTPTKPETRTRTILTTRSKNIVHEETISAQGIKREDWHVGQMQYALLPGTSQWFQGSDKSTFPANGFRDLDWITEESYAGKANLGDRSCLIFVPAEKRQGQTASGLLEKLDSLPTVAYIDAQSRLPVRVREDGIQRAYQFLAPPTSMLSLPPDLAQTLKKADDTRARLSQPPPRPY